MWTATGMGLLGQALAGRLALLLIGVVAGGVLMELSPGFAEFIASALDICVAVYDTVTLRDY